MSFTVVVMRAILAAAEQHGLSQAKSIASTSWSSAEIDDMTLFLGDKEFANMLEALVDLSDNRQIGLILGTLCSEHSLHLFGQILLASPSLRDAAKALEELGPSMIGGPAIRLVVDGDSSARLQLEAVSDSLSSRFVAEFLLAIFCKMALRFAGPSTALVASVQFAFPRPSYAQHPTQVLGVPASFGHREHALVFSPKLLDQTVPGTHAQVVVALRRLAYTELVAPRFDRSWSSRVRALLKRTSELAHVDFNLVARELGVTLRTLRRRIHAENMTLSEVLDGARAERATTQLVSPEESIKLVAEQLGYAEASSFHRAFKRWTGMTPAAYRRRSVSPDAH